MLLRLADFFLFAGLAAAPLMYGSVQFLPLLFLALLSLIVFNLVVFSRPQAFVPVLRSFWVWLGLFLLAFVLFQLLPLPYEQIKLLSPATFDLYARTLPGGIPVGGRDTLSVYSNDTIMGLVQFMTYGLFFVTILLRLAPVASADERLTAPHPLSLVKTEYLRLGCLSGVLSLLFHSIYDFNLHIAANGIYFVVLLGLGTGSAGRKDYDHSFFRRMIDFVIMFGFLVALFAIVQKFSYNGRIFWLGMKAPNPVGPYYNYDHFAGFMELCSATATGMAVASIMHTSFSHCKGLSERLLWFSTPEANRTLRYILMSAVMISTIFMSTSRGGIMSFLLSQIIFFALVLRAAARSSKKKRFAGILTTVLLLAGVMVVWLGPEEFLARFRLLSIDKIVKMEGPIGVRLDFYKGAWKVFKDFSFFGTGVNTFGTNFARYRTFNFEIEYLRQAHNDYLHLMSETGYGGVIFLSVFLLLFAAVYLRTASRLQ
jgi:hypothetical protein